jgi:hypothetical protein
MQEGVLGKSGTLLILRCGGGLSERTAKQLIPCFQEKSLSIRCSLTVPQTDTGGQVENTKALERTWVKELGKIAP